MLGRASGASVAADVAAVPALLSGVALSWLQAWSRKARDASARPWVSVCFMIPPGSGLPLLVPCMWSCSGLGPGRLLCVAAENDPVVLGDQGKGPGKLLDELLLAHEQRTGLVDHGDVDGAECNLEGKGDTRHFGFRERARGEPAERIEKALDGFLAVLAHHVPGVGVAQAARDDGAPEHAVFPVVVD